jgi:hypothetical protein
MIINRSIRLKAAFLLIVFSLNTIVGFACSMGVDMGFNTSHSNGEAAKASVHKHKDGKKHENKPETGKKHAYKHKETASKKDDCCKEKVVKLQTSDKALTHAQASIHTPVFIVSSFFQFSSFNTVKGVPQKYIAYQFHPPPRDIRITIQSFQI